MVAVKGLFRDPDLSFEYAWDGSVPTVPERSPLVTAWRRPRWTPHDKYDGPRPPPSRRLPLW